MTKELTFLLQKGEKIIADEGRCFYAGVGIIMFGSGFGAIGKSGLGGGIFSGKQIKREGSVWDSQPSHIYVTNKRLVFCKAKISLFGGGEKEIGAIFAEIPFGAIKGLTKNTKLLCPAIDISVATGNGIDSIKFWFTSTTLDRSAEIKARDKIFNLIQKQV